MGFDLPNGSGNGFTVKEIVIEIRDTVKGLAEKVDRIDRQSIGTKEAIEDHENRLRDHESRIQKLEDKNSGEDSAQSDIETWWQHNYLKWSLVIAALGYVATIVWLTHG